MTKHKKRWAIAPAALMALALAACGDRAGGEKGAAEPSSETLEAALKGDDQLNTLEAVVDRAGLSSVLEGVGPYTVFAPVDAAFATPDAFTAEGATAPAAALIRAHIVPGALKREDIAAAIERADDGKVEMRTMADGLMTFSRDGQAMVVTAPDGSTARLTGEEELVRNGAIQPIDGLLVKPAA